jgi:hypothetical protein
LDPSPGAVVTVGAGGGVTGFASAIVRAGGVAEAATGGIGVSAGAGAGVAGVGAAGAGGLTRRMTTGVVFGCTWAGAGAGRCTTGATAGLATTGLAGSRRRTCGTGSARAWTIAGCDTAGTSASGGVWPPPGPARRRGNAAAPATAPASNKPATTPLVIALMVPTPDADSITPKRYRQGGARA